ncbi:MAG: glycoside hydrolase family 28 protein [Halobacteriaceae archaeon]
MADPWAYADRIEDRVEPPTFPDRTFDVTEHGAVGDGETDCTAAFAEAVAACTDAGGGRVLVPAGEYRTGAIHLADDVELHVTADATVGFSHDPSDYLPTVLTRFEGQELYNYSPFVYARDCENVAITGEGTLDGRADVEAWWPWSGSERYGWEEGAPQGHDDVHALRDMASEGVPVAEREFGEGHYLRPSFVQPYACENVLIEGVTLVNSPMWNVHPVLCENLTVRDVTVDGDGPNNDGCNPESCRDVLVEGCTFDAGDDCIAVKSGREADGRRVDVPSENVLVQSCEFVNLYGSITLGSELSGGVRNVFVRHCEGGSPWLYFGLYIKTNSRRGGFVEQVHVKDVHFTDLSKEVVSCDFHRGEGDTGAFTPRVEDVTLTDVTVEEVRGVMFARGYDRSPIRGLRFENCTFENVEELAVVENAEVELEDVTVNGQTVESVEDLRERLVEKDV